METKVGGSASKLWLNKSGNSGLGGLKLVTPYDLSKVGLGGGSSTIVSNDEKVKAIGVGLKITPLYSPELSIFSLLLSFDVLLVYVLLVERVASTMNSFLY
jgi:hypothetical protein